MKLVDRKIPVHELKEMASKMYGDLVKAVVDIEKEIMSVDAELHADEEKFLLENGSKQENLWGINLYPDTKGENFLEYDSMINLRPSQGNRSRGVDDEKIRERIREVVHKLIENGIPA
ncbi:MAG: DUF5674 family protein [Patescibacteria group bacterium]|jgi:hypothetical protein